MLTLTLTLAHTLTVTLTLTRTLTNPNHIARCTRFGKQWFFNTADGKSDGVSEPVCKLASG